MVYLFFIVAFDFTTNQKIKVYLTMIIYTLLSHPSNIQIG